MNQNLLIVDDEVEILSWLEEMFRYDFDREIGVYTANSARKALEILDRVRIDVVLTDIRMPGMDGITLFKKIKENWPRCKTVFLTGYRNFEDIYQIINHKDTAYILKSEEDETIMEAVRRFLVLEVQELEQESLLRKQELQLEKAKSWMQRELMAQVCIGIKQEKLNEKLEDLGISLKADRKTLLFLLRIDGQWREEKLQEKFMQEENLLRILQDNVPGKLRLHVHIMEKQQVAVFIQSKDTGEEKWDKISVISCGMIEYVQEAFQNMGKDTLSAIECSEAVYFDGIPSVLKRLKSEMIRYIGGEQGIILKESSLVVQTNETQPLPVTGKVIDLKYFLELRKRSDYFELLESYLNRMACAKSRHDTQALEIYYNVSTLLLQFINENHLNEQLAFEIGIYKLTRVDVHESWTEAETYLTEVSEAIFRLLDVSENNLTRRALKRVVNYINEHLEDDLSLSTLAEIGGFNASYLSRLFKQVQGESISAFILHKRMELAKKLLLDTDEKIQDITMRTGYITTQSFTRAFRNENGISPTEYRELNK